MRKFILWFFAIFTGVSLIGAMLTEGEKFSDGSQQNKAPEKPSNIELKRQRVAANKQAEADFQRMDKLDHNAFCTRELTKLRTSKLSSEQIEAVELQSMRFLVTTDEFESVKKKTVHIGMSSCAAMASWGRPERINTSQGANYSQEQWVYNNDYLYVQNHRITSMQTSR